MVYGIVVAGGQGTRIGFRKQFAMLRGKPVWRRSVEALLAGGVVKIWLAAPAEDVERLQSEVRHGALSDRLRVVAGGESRFASVRNALSALLDECGNGESPSHVAVHDAARPFVLPRDVASVIAVAKEHGGAILATPSPDTVKSVHDGRIVATIPRDGVWLAETPQVFATAWMKQRYFEVDLGEMFTDDASLFEGGAHSVWIVPATGYNRKITTPDDWEYATWLAEQRWGGEGNE